MDAKSPSPSECSQSDVVVSPTLSVNTTFDLMTEVKPMHTRYNIAEPKIDLRVIDQEIYRYQQALNRQQAESYPRSCCMRYDCRMFLDHAPHIETEDSNYLHKIEEKNSRWRGTRETVKLVPRLFGFKRN